MICDRIKQLREPAGYSQAQLAKLFLCFGRTYTAWAVTYVYYYDVLVGRRTGTVTN